MKQPLFHSAWLLVALSVNVSTLAADGDESAALDWIRASDDGANFVRDSSGERFVVWGVNYDHDRDGRLLEDYWHDEWPTVVADFREIKRLGANTVRVHLQLGKFMETADRASDANLQRLKELVQLAERTGLYLDVTGLGCYHKQDVPPWYDTLSESQRWAVQRRFWVAIATVCQASPAIFCYDLMNEPILPGKKPETDWLTGELEDKFFVQRISLDLKDRTRSEVATAWVQHLTSAIREIDDRHMVTVGVIPWAHVFKNAKPLFYSPEVGGSLDFVSVHFYPKRDDIVGSLEALKVYELGKPLVVEEIFPLKCSMEEADEFINRSRSYVDGWVSFYWGETIVELRQHGDLQHSVIAAWLEYFQSEAQSHRAPKTEP